LRSFACPPAFYIREKMKNLFICLPLMIALLGCRYDGSISQYDSGGKLVARWEFKSSQPIMMKAGGLESDSRTKPLIESLMLDLGYNKNSGDGDFRRIRR